MKNLPGWRSSNGKYRDIKGTDPKRKFEETKRLVINMIVK